MRRFSILVKQSCDKTKAKTTGPFWKKKKTQNRLETQRSAPPLKFSSVLFLQKRLWIFLPFSLCHFIFKLRHSLQRDRFLLSALMSEVGEAAAALSPAFQCHSQAVFPITPATAISSRVSKGLFPTRRCKFTHQQAVVTEEESLGISFYSCWFAWNIKHGEDLDLIILSCWV